jgi:hypothetical protein
MPCTQQKYHTPFLVSSLTCPKCQANSFEDGFGVDARHTGEGCETLHLDDILFCPQCFYNGTGKKYAERRIKEENLIPCPHCKGTGLVKK